MAKAFIDDTNLTNIGNAIRSQNGTTTTYLPSEMADAINALPVLDTSDGTATSGDIANGKIAYVNGERVTGSLPDYKLETNDTIGSFGNNCMPSGNVSYEVYNVATAQIPHIKIYGTAKRNAIIRKDEVYYHVAPAGVFGDATPADVASGKTFTSIEGLKITGTATIGEGLNTSDATATASDIVDGKTAYVNGEKITGNVPYESVSVKTSVEPSICHYSGDNTSYLCLAYPSTGAKRVIGKGKSFDLTRPLSDFGNATAADVAAGKTFTSSAGLKVTGTGSSSSSTSSNNNCEAYHITSASTALSFKRTDGTIKVWGYGYASTSTYTKTVYAFCGNGYYTSSSYGTPSKTSVTWGLNSNGTLSGLPSGLSALDVLVTRGV